MFMYSRVLPQPRAQAGDLRVRGGQHPEHPDVPRQEDGQHPHLVHVRHGRRAAPHGRQRLLQPPHLPVCRPALPRHALRHAGNKVR